jgi:hypothetical protein
VFSGIIIGLVVISAVTSNGVKKEPAAYQPFPAGPADRIVRNIERGGPIFYSDPKGGTKAFYLDLVDGDIAAIAVVPPGGSAECPVEWNRRAERYQDCDGDQVDPESLNQFRIRTRGPEDDESVFVDIRSLVPPA